MVRINRSGGAICAAVVAVSLLAAGGRVKAVEVSVCWDDEAPTHNWTDADNWNPSTAGGPRNIGILEFLVAIGCLTPSHPTGAYDPVNFDVTTPVEITDLLLRNDSRLVLNLGTDLTVLRTADIAGIIDAKGGNFTAMGSAALTGNRARVFASDEAHVRIAAPAYSSTGLFVGNACGTFNWTLLSADGPLTELNLSTLASINAGFTDNPNPCVVNHQHIAVTDAALLNLSGVTTLNGPGLVEDSLRVTVSGADSMLDMSSLATITTQSSGFTIFDVADATISFPALSAADRATFDVSGGEVHLPALEDVLNTRFHAADAAQVMAITPPQVSPVATYASTGLFVGNACGTFNWTLLSADGPLTELNLSTLASINAGFTDNPNPCVVNHQHIAVTDAALLNLSGVTTLNGPGLVEDSLRVTVSGTGSMLDLSALGTITSAGTGRVLVDIANEGHVQLGNLSNISATTVINLGTDSVLTVGSLQADSTLTITAPTGGTVRVGGDFLYTHTNTASLSLGLAHVECVGDWQWLEVGGTDYDLQWQLHPDRNFGYEQLVIGQPVIIGQPGHATVVQLVDLFDNHQPGIPDSLLLWGIPDVGGMNGKEGLSILGGSTLVIGDLMVYALLDLDGNHVMERTRIHDLFQPGETRIRFDHNGNDGYIIRPEIMPPIGAIDARQTSDPDGTNPVDGWSSIDLVYLGTAQQLVPADFLIEVAGGAALGLSSLNLGTDKVSVVLDGPMLPGSRVKITHLPSGSRTCVGYLPGDVNGNGTSNEVDALALINCLKGVAQCKEWQADTDRSTVAGSSDIVRVIDILNGAGVYNRGMGLMLPECP